MSNLDNLPTITIVIDDKSMTILIGSSPMRCLEVYPVKDLPSEVASWIRYLYTL